MLIWMGGFYYHHLGIAEPTRFTPQSCRTEWKSDFRDFRMAAKQVMPSVVSIAAGERVQGKFQLKRTGTGVIWSEGVILTSAHVIQGQKELRARTYERRVVLLKELARDEILDIALLQAVHEDALGQPPAIWKSTQAAEVGMWVAALGHPYDMSYSLSVGAVSALHRGSELPGWKGRFPGFIQTDLTLNPGNSGGPLLNQCGEMIGLNTAILNAAQGLSLSLPLSRLEPVIKKLLEEGRFERSYIGLTLKYVSYKHSEKAALKPRVGVRVKRVVDNGPGYLAELKVNDIILEADGIPFHDETELSWKLISTPAYQPIQLKVIRIHQEVKQVLSLTLIPWTMADKLTRHTVPRP